MLFFPLLPIPRNRATEGAGSPLPAAIGHEPTPLLIVGQLAMAVGGTVLLTTRPQLRDAARHWAKARDKVAAGHVVVFSLPEPLASREKGRATAAGAGLAGSRPASASRPPQQRGQLVPTTPNPSSCVTLRVLNLQSLVDSFRRQSPTHPFVVFKLL